LGDEHVDNVRQIHFPERQPGGLIMTLALQRILAIFGLIGREAPIMAVIATIVFGMTLLIQGNGICRVSPVLFCSAASLRSMVSTPTAVGRLFCLERRRHSRRAFAVELRLGSADANRVNPVRERAGLEQRLCGILMSSDASKAGLRETFSQIKWL
jgi:hypothetical protein